MNRENKRKTFEKGYYKTHACNDTFTCKVCGRVCTPQNAGSDHRNHCPNCLSSLHVDEEPGDRASDCGGIMEPVAVWVRKGGEWAIIHRCKRCGKLSTPQNAGSDHRNHCPNCLSSLHVDEEPGDRASDCGGIMEPVAVWVRKGGEWAIIHRCKRCGKLSSNRVTADDNPMKLMSIAMKPLCAPPFPLDYIEEMTALMGGDGRMR